MSETEYELAIDPGKARGGYAALAYHDEATDSYIVNGVALGPGDRTQGMSGKPTTWPADVLEDATELLKGTPITAGRMDAKHPGAEKEGDVLRVDDKAPDDSVIGHVTKTRWDDALGLLWQGSINDEDIADQIEQGRVDVSPVVNRDVEPTGEDKWEATAVHGFRDLTVLPPEVPGAAPSNHIESGEMAEALAGAFPRDDEETRDEPAESGATEDVESPDTSDDDPARASTGGSGQINQTMSDTDNDLTESQRELLAAAQHTDDPAVVAGEDADKLSRADELLAAAEDISGDVTVVAEDEFSALTEHVETIDAMLNEALVESRGLRENTVEAMSFEAKASEFETEDGGLDAEALVMSPETGDMTDDEDDASGVDALSADERENVELCVKQAKRMERHSPDFAAEKREEAAEALGLDPEADLSEIKEAL